MTSKMTHLLFFMFFLANINLAQKTVSLKGLIADTKNHEIKIQATIDYTDDFGKVISTKTNGNGEYLVELSPNQTYMVKVQANGYHVQNFPIDITDKLQTKNHYLIQTTIITPKKPKILQSVYFELSSADLSATSKSYLDKIVEILILNPRQKIKLIGYSDKGSHSDLDLQLSIERSQAISSYLQSKGINRERIESRGKGNVSLIVPSPNQKNRRVEMEIVE